MIGSVEGTANHLANLKKQHLDAAQQVTNTHQHNLASSAETHRMHCNFKSASLCGDSCWASDRAKFRLKKSMGMGDDVSKQISVPSWGSRTGSSLLDCTQIGEAKSGNTSAALLGRDGSGHVSAPAASSTAALQDQARLMQSTTTSRDLVARSQRAQNARIAKHAFEATHVQAAAETINDMENHQLSPSKRHKLAPRDAMLQLDHQLKELDEDTTYQGAIQAIGRAGGVIGSDHVAQRDIVRGHATAATLFSVANEKSLRCAPKAAQTEGQWNAHTQHGPNHSYDITDKDYDAHMQHEAVEGGVHFSLGDVEGAAFQTGVVEDLRKSPLAPNRLSESKFQSVAKRGGVTSCTIQHQTQSPQELGLKMAVQLSAQQNRGETLVNPLTGKPVSSQFELLEALGLLQAEVGAGGSSASSRSNRSLKLGLSQCDLSELHADTVELFGVLANQQAAIKKSKLRLQQLQKYSRCRTHCEKTSSCSGKACRRPSSSSRNLPCYVVASSSLTASGRNTA